MGVKRLERMRISAIQVLLLLLLLFLRPQIPRGIRQQPITKRECVPRGWPTLRATRPLRIEGEKMAEDAESNIAIRFVHEND